MSRFEFTPAPLSGVFVVQRKPLGDSRGFFARFFCADEFADAGVLTKPITQINHSLTEQKGTVRGLHFQHPPYAETKIVSCTRGEVFDVMVDLRRGSPTFLQWHSVILSEQNQRSVVIPEGFAHGIQTLTAECELVYLVTAPYHPASEAAVHVSDPRVGVRWPLEIALLSDRDRAHPMLTDSFHGIDL